MPWFRVCDTACFHPKMTAAGNAALGLWTRAGAWSMQNLTEGHVPTRDARAMGSRAEIKRLVEVGLWDEVEGGYEFHEWDERQPTKEQIQGKRVADAARQKRARERSVENFAAKSHAVTNGVSHAPPIPAHPSPTHKSPNLSVIRTPATAPNGKGSSPATNVEAGER